MLKNILIAVLVVTNLATFAVLTRFMDRMEGIGAFFDATFERRLSQIDAIEVQPGDVVFLGDSLIREGDWAELFPDHKVRNRGVGGDTSADVLARLPQIAEGRPGKVFLQVGTNDLSAGVPPEETAQNITTIINAVAAASPDAEIFVQSVPPRERLNRERVEALNQTIKTSLPEAATWIDIYDAFLDPQDGSIDNRYSNDEVHITGAGYLRWRDLIDPHLQTTN